MSSFEKWSVWITSVLTGVTGLAYFWAKYLVEPTDPFAVVNHPLEPWFLKAHILVSPFLLVALGMILLRHVVQHWWRGVMWGRKSGIAMALFVVPMAITGYLIQVVTRVGWLEALAWAHIGAGAVYLLGLAVHQAVVKLTSPPPSKRRLYAIQKRRKPVGRPRDELEKLAGEGKQAPTDAAEPETAEWPEGEGSSEEPDSRARTVSREEKGEPAGTPGA